MHEEITAGTDWTATDYYEHVLEGDVVASRILNSLYEALRKRVADLGCRNISLNMDVPDQDHFCSDLLGVSPASSPEQQEPIDTGKLSDAQVGLIDLRHPGAPARSSDPWPIAPLIVRHEHKSRTDVSVRLLFADATH